MKHSQTYSGGHSRSYTRTYAPLRLLGFEGFSPFTRPGVIAAAERIPFAAMTRGSHERLYALKGEIVSKGVEAVTGLRMPVFPKRRFQQGRSAAFLREVSVPRDGLQDAPLLALRVSAEYPASPSERDGWILARRGPRNRLDPAAAYAELTEEEPDGSGGIVSVSTIFLTNRECPWRCLMCDLDTEEMSAARPHADRPRSPDASVGIKLYNPSADPRAILIGGSSDDRRLGEFGRVNGVPLGPRVSPIRDARRPEVAMGLETSIPNLPKLNVDDVDFAGFPAERESRTACSRRPPLLEASEAVAGGRSVSTRSTVRIGASSPSRRGGWGDGRFPRWRASARPPDREARTR
jgi:hypothetical protein